MAEYAYDGTMLATNALKKCNLDSECVKDELYKTKKYEGALGEFSIDPDGGTTRTFIEKMVKDGKFISVG